MSSSYGVRCGGCGATYAPHRPEDTTPFSGSSAGYQAARYAAAMGVLVERLHDEAKSKLPDCWAAELSVGNNRLDAALGFVAEHFKSCKKDMIVLRNQGHEYEHERVAPLTEFSVTDDALTATSLVWLANDAIDAVLESDTNSEKDLHALKEATRRLASAVRAAVKRSSP